MLFHWKSFANWWETLYGNYFTYIEKDLSVQITVYFVVLLNEKTYKESVLLLRYMYIDINEGQWSIEKVSFRGVATSKIDTSLIRLQPCQNILKLYWHGCSLIKLVSILGVFNNTHSRQWYLMTLNFRHTIHVILTLNVILKTLYW